MTRTELAKEIKRVVEATYREAQYADTKAKDIGRSADERERSAQWATYQTHQWHGMLALASELGFDIASSFGTGEMKVDLSARGRTYASWND